MRELLRRAAQWRIRRTWLTSERENEAAVRLWRRLSFVNQQADDGEDGLWVTRDFKGPGRDRVVFAYELNGGTNGSGGRG